MIASIPRLCNAAAAARPAEPAPMMTTRAVIGSVLAEGLGAEGLGAESRGGAAGGRQIV
jgi:hypothetical protein